MQTDQEIRAEELSEQASLLRAALDRLLESTAFRTSTKSCEFLRHIVHHTLEGRVDELKERLIGMSLLGRDADYDTGSDAGVRVRANEVRKRLLAHYSQHRDEAEIVFDLPVGSYVPRFFRVSMAAKREPVVATPEELRPLPAAPVVAPALLPLSLYRLAAPTLVALFLCVLCLRWQLAEEYPFTAFWQTVLAAPRCVLYLPADGTGAHAPPDELQRLRTTASLLTLAGQFHSHFDIVTSLAAKPAETRVVVTIGDGAGDGAGDAALGARERFQLVRTAGGERVVDRDDAGASAPVHAGLITVVNGASHTVHLDGTDEQSLGTLIHLLCDRSTFPASLRDPFEEGTVVQVLFPLAPSSTAVEVYRQRLDVADASVRP